MPSEPVCTNCGIKIRWQPTITDGKTYCCVGCACGGPCVCDYDNLPSPGEIQPIVLHSTSEGRGEKVDDV
jgi:hypothetical protein